MSKRHELSYKRLGKTTPAHARRLSWFTSAVHSSDPTVWRQSIMSNRPMSEHPDLPSAGRWTQKLSLHEGNITAWRRARADLGTLEAELRSYEAAGTVAPKGLRQRVISERRQVAALLRVVVATLALFIEHHPARPADYKPHSD